MTQYVLAGSSSGTGHAVWRSLVETVRAESVICLVLKSSNIRPHRELKVKTIIGDVTDQASFEKLLDVGVRFIYVTHSKHSHMSLNTIQNSKNGACFFVMTTGFFLQ